MNLAKLYKVQQKNMGQILDNQKFTDVTFVVGKDKQEFNVNRIFLAAISPVFEAMLYGQMAESKADSKVVIEDATPNAFEQVIKFAYCNKPDIDLDNVHDIASICDKYQIATLSTFCDVVFKFSIVVYN